MSLTLKFIIFLHLASIIPVLIVGISAYEVSRTILQDEAKRYADELVIQQREYLDLQLEEIENIITNVVSTDAIIQALSQKPITNNRYTRLATQARIGYILDGYANLSDLVSLDIFTFSGDYYHVGDTLDTSNIRMDVRDRLIARARVLGPNEIWAGIEANINATSTTHQVITVARLISVLEREATKARPVAVLLVNYDINHLYEHFRRTDLDSDSTLLVVDGEQRIVYHHDPAFIGNTLSDEFYAQLEDSDTTQGNFTKMIDAEEVLVNYAHFDQYDWKVITLIPVKLLNTRSSTISGAVILALLVAFMIAGIAAIIASYTIVLPLRHLTQRFQLYRADAPGWHIPLEVHGSDEIAELSRWFNLFSESLLRRRQIEEELRHQATHDGLTGLPNRIHFSQQLEATLKQVHTDSLQLAAVLFLDLDRFKIVNDSLGHAAGDQVLIITARRLRNSVRTNDTLARLGGG